MIALRNPVVKSEPPAPAVPRLLLKPLEAANCLGVSLRTLMAWKDAGEIPFVMLSERVLRFAVADLEAWISERSTRRPEASPP